MQRDYSDTLTRLLQHIRPGGIVFFSTNFRRFKFEPETIPAASIFEISRQTVPADFRNRRIHRCWKIVARVKPAHRPISRDTGPADGLWPAEPSGSAA